MLLELARARARKGLSLRARAIQLEMGGCYNAAARIFGTWRKVVEASGLTYPGRPRIWSRDKVLQEIRKRAQVW